MKRKFLFFMKRMLVLVFVIHFTSTIVQSQPIKGSWKSITGMPTARWFPGTAVFDGKVYLIGGEPNASVAPLSIVEVYDPATDSWETKTPMPTPRAQVSACTLNGKIYAIGGSTGPSSWTPVPNVDIYDPITDSWSKGADLPTPRTELGLVAVNGKIYAIGGITAGSAGSTSVDIYDPEANTWSKGTDMPTPRGTMPACELDGKIYVFGGSNGGATGWNHNATLEVYDVAANSWSAKADMPFSRSHLTGCVLNNKIYAIGGTELNKNLSYADMASYNPVTDSWEIEPSMITAREAFTAVIVNNKIYAIGGTIVQNGLVAFSNSEVYDPTPKVFLTGGDMRLPVKQGGMVGQLYVPGSGSLKFTYSIDPLILDGALFEISNDSLVAVDKFDVDAKKNYQIDVLAVSENNDSVRTLIEMGTYYRVEAVFTTPMGFLLTSSDKKVMLDVLSSKSPGYGFLANSDEIYETMKNGGEPYTNIDLVFTSHTHACHFDPVLLLNTMKNNPNAISIMNQDVKKTMDTYLADYPNLLGQVFAPVIPLNTSIDTTLAGIKLKLTSIAHEGATVLAINVLLDSIQFLLFDDYNDLSLAQYKTIGFTQISTDVALLGSFLLNGGQQIIKQTFSTSSWISISHIANYSTALYNTCVSNAEKLNALNYQVNVLNYPMEIFSYRKSDSKITMTTLNSSPKLNRTFNDIEVEKYATAKVYVPKTSFKDSDPGDSIKYSFSISNNPLPEWAVFDSEKQNLLFTPVDAKTYNVKITAVDRHMAYGSATFKLKVKVPDGIENIVTDSDFKVYPNPVKSLLNIESRGGAKDNYLVNLYTMSGEKIYSGYGVHDDKTTIDLSGYSETLLFLVITNDGENEYHKIIRY